MSKRRRRRSRAPQQSALLESITPLQAGYAQLTALLGEEHAKARAIAAVKGIAVADVPLDLRGAQQILAEHPALGQYLDLMRERNEAKAEALGTGGNSTRSYANPNVAGFTLKDAPTQSSPRDETAGQWGRSKDAAVGIPQARQLRGWADSNEWVRAAIDHLRDQASQADIAIAPQDEKKRYDRKVQQQVERLLREPNEFRQNWTEFIGSVIEDYYTLGRGTLSKNMNAKRQPVYLYAEDAATIKMYPGWSGNADEPRYLYEESGTSRKVPLRNDECIMMLYDPASYRISLSPLQVLQNTIRADMKATVAAMNLVDFKPPPHLVHVKGAKRTQINALRNEYDAEIAGSKEMFWLGSENDISVFPLVFDPAKMQFLDWQIYLARKIAAVFKISPQTLGILMDVNRANAEVQQDIQEDSALIPLLLTIERYFNREILSDFAPTFSDGRSNLDALNLRIFFPQVSEAARLMHAKEAITMAQSGMPGLPSMTLNQVLALRGEERVKGGNTFFINTATGAVPWLSYDGELGDYEDFTSDGGQLGAQDAAGGPTDGTNANPDANAPAPPASETPPASDQDTAKATPQKRVSPTLLDPRRPGQRWSPASDRVEIRGLDPIGTLSQTASDAHARSHTAQNARATLTHDVLALFEEAERRGHGALSQEE